MIITANSIAHDVNVLSTFQPTYIPSFKWNKLLNGTYFSTDRGIDCDKYESKFTVIGDTADIETLAENIRLEKGQITLNIPEGRIFGEAILYSSDFTCNVIGKTISYPIRDKLTSILPLAVRVVSPIVYVPLDGHTLPTDIMYNYTIDRTTVNDVTIYDSICIGDYGRAIAIDDSSDIIKSEVTKISLTMKNEAFENLQYFIALQSRTADVTLNTISSLNLFLNTNPALVKFLSFSFKPKGVNYWDVTLTILKV